MDFFLWNLIWVTRGNISILKGTPGFHCTYTLLVLNCKRFDLKGHSQGKACLRESHRARFHLAGKNRQLLSWAISSPPTTWGWAQRTRAYECCWFFCLLDCCVTGRTRQEPGCHFQHGWLMEKATADLLQAQEALSTDVCIPIPGFLWMELFKYMWVLIK